METRTHTYPIRREFYNPLRREYDEFQQKNEYRRKEIYDCRSPSLLEGTLEKVFAAAEAINVSLRTSPGFEMNQEAKGA